MSDAQARTADLVIVGGGIAGLCAALRAPEHARIIVVDKGETGAGSSPLAQGGLAAAVGMDDAPDLHAADTLKVGDGLCDIGIVKDVCAEGPAAVAWLLALGVEFDLDDDGNLHLAREGGQSVGRSVHTRDATGQEIVRALRAAVAGRDVTRMSAHATTLLRDADGRCAGVRTTRGDVLARTTLLASGGAGALWAATTNARGATGDGLALALAAGAQCADLEFMQFHPTALAVSGAERPLLTEALRGHGATLIDANGERFVDELGPRHVVTAAILRAGGAWLDCRSLTDLERAFPTVVASARARGFDPLTQPLPVEPAAHYFIGGVASDAHGGTSIPGLLAAGEVASTGMHGANRMAGNSLLETVVVGGRAGARALDEPLPQAAEPSGDPLTAPDPALPEILWRGAGPVRDEDGLREALAALDQVDDQPHTRLAAAICRSARARQESRGVHARADYPSPDTDLAVRSFERVR